MMIHTRRRLRGKILGEHREKKSVSMQDRQVVICGHIVRGKEGKKGGEQGSYSHQ
jgi:hypothetical protein